MAVTDLLAKAARATGDLARRTERLARYAGGVAQGAQHRVTGRGAKPDMDDVTLTRKVESVVFRPAGAPRGDVDVNAVDGVIYLHGQVRTPSDVNALEDAVRAIPEVRGVENLLHLPNTPAPTRADAPRKQQKSRRTAPRSAAPTAGKRTQRVSTQRTSAGAEPTGADLAAKGRGRQAAPLGSKGPDDAR
jgi:hypothetical protein